MSFFKHSFLYLCVAVMGFCIRRIISSSGIPFVNKRVIVAIGISFVFLIVLYVSYMKELEELEWKRSVF